MVYLAFESDSTIIFCSFKRPQKAFFFLNISKIKSFSIRMYTINSVCIRFKFCKKLYGYKIAYILPLTIISKKIRLAKLFFNKKKYLSALAGVRLAEK